MANKLQKKDTFALKEKTQYALTFGVIATMLVVAGFPMVVVFFFGVFAYFLWKTFSQPSQKGIREVFEFYLAANEILRDDDRKWFGFEVQNAINQGESILQRMHGAPPLVYFSLGALYAKIGDHASAISHLAYVVENENADESTYLHPSKDLREYVRLLRKIERDPKEAPQNASAIRTLERLRKNKGTMLLEESRAKAPDEEVRTRKIADKLSAGKDSETENERVLRTVTETGMNEREPEARNGTSQQAGRKSRFARKRSDEEEFSDRKPITEVLHDIYDKNVQ
ncbi:MAG: hypothetical protein DWQ47_05250 [Acidobacteria bacterium]|nr:MAG: hypothetical protein DWQ32_08800 [Acidobacteriota bacterium]REK01788.1 MAG: hypothetical protein DWQ38_05235 [Acidobacteriota bacterium]REK14744.1 MAG: hypothetical protein DWQ43_14490 [Acidobacteriota bacterium]REK45459.1 MAG: hypothetical protein DWQ47_05250 [Acidobacteriota bacterium]